MLRVYAFRHLFLFAELIPRELVLAQQCLERCSSSTVDNDSFTPRRRI